jgi:hypothetical protein
MNPVWQMARSPRRLLTAIMLTVMMGCASAPQGEQFSALLPAKAGKALVYLYRPTDSHGGVNYPVLIDDEKVADIGNGGYLVIPVDPGDHTIRITALGYKDTPLELTTEVGNHFLKIATARGTDEFTAMLSLVTVGEATALKDLAQTKREPERFVDDAL